MEANPNPNSLKFVANFLLVDEASALISLMPARRRTPI
ncbi:hypothetical protein A3SI_01676 [Nitritalea halalkaliphila LW7]|uniref:Uncharacterized protein n=1 Tax=Nitritalea halalkaliphila LW7 TaxID=1189621 RepID=I5CA87_9BACT|nr:hypothetical protein A3SI_01676 [Nitritalea halalkaliphila LW7]